VAIDTPGGNLSSKINNLKAKHNKSKKFISERFVVYNTTSSEQSK
jgi:hypothetical protein